MCVYFINDDELLDHIREATPTPFQYCLVPLITECLLERKQLIQFENMKQAKLFPSCHLAADGR